MILCANFAIVWRSRRAYILNPKGVNEMSVIAVVVCLIIAYLVGSLPVGYWIGKKAKGQEFDIRDHGSCSIGATNVNRVLGGWIALPVLILDAAKGYLPVLIGIHIGGEIFGGICLIVVMLGHAKSLYFYWKEGVFSGGKSVASALGGMLALQPGIAVWSLAFFLIVLVIPWSRYMSLASMFASIFAFVLTFVFHLSIVWHVIFALVVVMIFYTHRRNIARLRAGIEPKLGQRSEADEIVSAFALHPLDRSDFDQTPLTSWVNSLVTKGVISERRLEWLIARSPVLETSEITGIHTKDGKLGRVLILAIPLLPHQIQDPAFRPILDALLRAAAVQAQRRGATVLTLGALLSSYSKGGSDLQEWCIERGLTITIDNGAAFTVAATLEVILKKLKRSSIKLDQATIAIVGAKGLIGRRLSEELQKKAKKVIPLARERNTKGEKLDIDLSSLHDVDLVIFATSAPNTIVTKDNVHSINPDAIIVDVAVPPDVAADVEREVVRSGLIRLPGDELQIAMKFHFGEEDGVELVPACLVQGFILAATGRFEFASRWMWLRHRDIAFFRRASRLLGIQTVISDLSEPAVFGKVA